MLILISPAKKLDYDNPAGTKSFTQPEFLDHSRILIDHLRRYSSLDLAELMHLSMNLAELNFDRYRDWTPEFDLANAKQCLLAFKGDVYLGLDAGRFDEDELAFAQQHLRILSGLYGLLRPLDLMMPYRLEMGTRLPTERGKNLYEFWGTVITDAINRQLQALGQGLVVNLASAEYYKSVKPRALQGRVVTPQFKERKGTQYRVIGITAKRARGLMSRYIIENRITDAESLKGFDWDGYAYRPELSGPDDWVFARG